MKPQITDKVKVITKNGNKVCTIDSITKNEIHFKNKGFGLTVNVERIRYISKKWHGANFEYTSFN